MNGTNQELKKTGGADVTPQGMPEDIRLTLLANVAGRLKELRYQAPNDANEYELSRLVPAVQWLTGDTKGGAGAKH